MDELSIRYKRWCWVFNIIWIHMETCSTKKSYEHHVSSMVSYHVSKIQIPQIIGSVPFTAVISSDQKKKTATEKPLPPSSTDSFTG